MSDSDFALEEQRDDRLVTYKSINSLAVIAFLGSLVTAAIALTSIVGWVLAGITVLLAVAGIVTIGRNSDTQTGTFWALAAIAIALCSTSWGMSRHFSRSSRLTSGAVAFTQRWIDQLNQGNLLEAHQFMMARAVRRHPRMTPETFYQNNAEISKGKDSVYKSQPMRQIVEVLDASRSADTSIRDTRFEYIGVSEIFQENQWEVIILQYELRYREGTLRKNIPFNVMIGREVDAQGTADYKINRVDRPSKAA